MLFRSLSSILALSVLLSQVLPTEGINYLMFFDTAVDCGGGLGQVPTQQDSDGCNHYSDSSRAFQSASYSGNEDIKIFGYAMSGSNYCGNGFGGALRNNPYCVDAGSQRLTGITFHANPVVCGHPSRCRIAEKQPTQAQEMGFAGFRFFDDRESGIMYMLDPKTVDAKELEKANESSDFEYYKKNHTFYVPLKDLSDKEKWVYRK